MLLEVLVEMARSWFPFSYNSGFTFLRHLHPAQIFIWLINSSAVQLEACNLFENEQNSTNKMNNTSVPFSIDVAV